VELYLYSAIITIIISSSSFSETYLASYPMGTEGAFPQFSGDSNMKLTNELLGQEGTELYIAFIAYA
jgi:hypothetical protein